VEQTKHDGLLILLANADHAALAETHGRAVRAQVQQLARRLCRCRGIMDGNLGDKLRFFPIILTRSGPAASAFDSAAPLESINARQFAIRAALTSTA